MARNHVLQLELIEAHRSGRITDEQLMQAGHSGRKARLAPHRCGAWVLVGPNASRCALTATVEPYAITALGEVQALRDGRTTYDLRHGELEYRDRWSIPGKPPGPDRTVVADHRCGHPLADAWRRPPQPDTGYRIPTEPGF